ncbi:MAG TPA: helix-turn-helix domain-containing protein [Bacteroidia bacterium]|nr:helix-turn-helix domain-containing protein [Bacteroidia bacterium]HNT80474.1 helix-turn-helix domain-containing protein [Bacteroidia bacterium]
MSTTDKILDGAHHLFYQYGIRSVTMDDIASHLGMSKKTIYQYFPDKNKIVVELNDKLMGEHECRLIEIKNNAKNAIDEIISIMTYLRAFISEIHPAVFFDMQKYHEEAWKKYLNFKECCMIKMVEDNLKWGQEEGLYRKDMDINIIAIMRLHQVQMAFDQNVFSPKRFKLENVQMQMLSHFMHGITTLKGHKLINKLLHVNEDEN